ncbi:leucine--tRNA ligase [bacterium]|nr:leucine--tRNA ligase [bacterium]
MQSQNEYDFKSVQEKWNSKWDSMGLAKAVDFSKKPKKYALVELPYPSGEGLHMGHCWNYTLFDAYSRFYRLRGYNVLYPMGWDTFGLPTYNHAVKVGRAPQDVSVENIATFKRQLKELGMGFDWNREIDSASPEYYKWTQWIFVQMYEHWYDENFVRKDGGKGQARPISDLLIPSEIKKKGIKAIKEYQDNYRIAYKAKMPVAWCPKCKTGLANEEVLGDNTHERCGTLVEERELEQWMLRITAYAERLIVDLDTVDFPNGVKAAQKNWIGKKVGINVTYAVVDSEGKEVDKVTCFTSRPDTNFGATFVALAPEHPITKRLSKYVDEKVVKEIEKYANTSAAKTVIERESEGRKKTGVNTTLFCVNQLTGRKMPLYVSDFVLMKFGTGAVVGVPGHDVRDFQFAKAMGLEVIRVVKNVDGEEGPITELSQVQEAQGIMINSGFLNGKDIHAATQEIMNHMIEKGWGKRVVMYKFHDWIFSRQHYWGEPTPMVYCEDCGWSPVLMKDLPITLPKLEDYRMGEDGSSPLAKATEWIKTTCPSCGKSGRRETDVMPNWAGSNWYFLRYLDPHNTEKLVNYSIASYWMPVDLYYGGQEHVTLHLLYSRFVYKFLSDLGAVPGVEPYKSRRNHGIILGPDGRKMSKSWGNVVNPDQVVKKFGADAVRLYLMFIGPYDSVTPWSDKSIGGVARFVNKLYRMLAGKIGMVNAVQDKWQNGVSKNIEKLKRRVAYDIENLKFNTIVSSFMEFYNNNEKDIWTKEDITQFLITLSPFTPYIAEEMWKKLGNESRVHEQVLEITESTADSQEIVQIPVMVNGKVRARISVSISEAEEKVVSVAMNVAEVQKSLPSGYKKIVYVPGRAVNFVS